MLIARLCHMVEREGGRLRPDLISVGGSRRGDEMRDRSGFGGVDNPWTAKTAENGLDSRRALVASFVLIFAGEPRSPIRALHQLGAPQIMQVHNPLQLPASIHHHQ
jgi:hypothetical protein